MKITIKTAVQEIPDVLVYEKVNGQSIYYKGYKEYLFGTKKLEELMRSSYLST